MQGFLAVTMITILILVCTWMCTAVRTRRRALRWAVGMAMRICQSASAPRAQTAKKAKMQHESDCRDGQDGALSKVLHLSATHIIVERHCPAGLVADTSFAIGMLPCLLPPFRASTYLDLIWGDPRVAALAIEWVECYSDGEYHRLPSSRMGEWDLRKIVKFCLPLAIASEYYEAVAHVPGSGPPAALGNPPPVLVMQRRGDDGVHHVVVRPIATPAHHRMAHGAVQSGAAACITWSQMAFPWEAGLLGVLAPCAPSDYASRTLLDSPPEIFPLGDAHGKLASARFVGSAVCVQCIHTQVLVGRWGKITRMMRALASLNRL